MYYLVNKEKYWQICTCLIGFISLYLLVLNFAIKLKRVNYKSNWNILVFCDQWKMISDLNISQGKISNFLSFPMFGFTVAIKLRNFDFESHWNTLIFFDKKRYDVRFEYVPWKYVWFCFISDVWVCFCHKTEKFWFWSSIKYFNIFW